MSMPASVLNTNLGSMIARRNLAGAQTRLAESVERLSSGLRINRAKDDAAGMAVSSVIEGQTRVAATAHRNVNDAMSMVQTAEGALQEASGMLTRIKELATQGANDSMSRDQYYFLVQEMRQIMDELANISSRTKYNNNELLGASVNETVEVPTTTTVTRTTLVPTGGVPDSVWLSQQTAGLLDGLTGTLRIRVSVDSGNVRLDPGTTLPLGVSAVGSASNPFRDNLTSFELEGPATALADAIVFLQARRLPLTGSVLDVEVLGPPQFLGGDFANGLNGWTKLENRIRLDGVDSIGGWPTPVDQTRAPDGGIEASSEGSAFYGVSEQNGRAVLYSSMAPVVNSPNGSGGVVHGPTIISANSARIEAGDTVRFNWEASSGNDAFDVYGYLLEVNTGDVVELLNATGKDWTGFQPLTQVSKTVPTSGDYKFVFVGGTWDATRGTVAGARLTIDNVEISSTNPGVFTKLRGQKIDLAPQTFRREEITEQVQVVAKIPKSFQAGKLKFFSGSGSSDALMIERIPIWDMAENASMANDGKGYADGRVQVGALNALYSRLDYLFRIGPSVLSAGTGFELFASVPHREISMPSQLVYASDGSLVSSLTKTLNELVDDSLLQINAHRSYFGAYAGRMEHNVANLAALSENLTAAGSRIRDTDYGAETASLTRTQILQQAATAMLAQANAMPNVVLALLRQQ